MEASTAVTRLGIPIKGQSFYHNVRGAAMRACREGRRVEIRLGRRYPAIYSQCSKLTQQQKSKFPLREEEIFCQGIDMILVASAEDTSESGEKTDFLSLRTTCRVDAMGKVTALYIKLK